MFPERAHPAGSDDLPALVTGALALAPETDCARYLPASFDARRLAEQLDLLLRVG